MEKGATGIITYGDKQISRVEIIEIISYPVTGMHSDVIFKYDNEETYRPLNNPVNDGDFPLPKGLAEQVFTKD